MSKEVGAGGRFDIFWTLYIEIVIWLNHSQRKAVPKQCEYDISLEFNSY